MNIYDISFSVNACVLPFAPYTPNDNAEHRMEAFLQDFKNNADYLLNIDSNNGWHAGQAFYNVLTYHRNLSELDQKFSFAGAIISLIKALEMGTMQSIMAIDKLINMIKGNRPLIIPYVMAMSDERMISDFKMPSTLVSTSHLPIEELVDTRIKFILQFLSSLKENQINETNIEAKIGQKYLAALYEEAYQQINAHASFGIM